MEHNVPDRISVQPLKAFYLLPVHAAQCIIVCYVFYTQDSLFQVYAEGISLQKDCGGAFLHISDTLI